MREKKDEKDPALPIYQCQPPAWLPASHGTADLGYPGFYPPRPGQEEDILSASNVKDGFAVSNPVNVETFSAQTLINTELRSPGTLSKLEDLMNEVFVRRTERTSQIPASTFRMPTRVTLNDPKRQAWFADLANPDVPLYKLGKSVPHGAKGHDLLDLLQSHNVAITRAVWVLRVFGANETAGLRNKPNYNPTQYSIEWANVMAAYLRKQLHEIALPSAPRPGLNIKQTFKGVLSEQEPRERWIARFAYSLKLLQTFYYEGMVDRKTFLVWLVQQMAICNLAQAGFITRLVDEYIDDILDIRALAKPLAECSLQRLSEIHGTLAQEILSNTEGILKTILQRLCLAVPDVFIGPRLWSTHASLVEAVIAENLLDVRNPDVDPAGVRERLGFNFSDIRKRNEALSFLNSPAKVSAKLSAAVSHVNLLNSISHDSQLSQTSYFEQDSPSTPFAEKLDMLLTWSVTPLQYGEHRPLAAVTLIRQWRDKACERATRRGSQHPHELLQDHLFEWLDTSDVAGEKGNIKSVALLYGKLVKLELFNYPNYIQRLLARAEPGLLCTDSPRSRHSHFLSWIPLFNSTPSLIYQRKVVLHGVRTREIPEERVEKEIRRELRSVLPELFGESPTKDWSSTESLLEQCQCFVKSSRYEQVRTFKQWLLPIFQKAASSASDPPALIRTFRVILELMNFSKCFNSILEMSLTLLHSSSDNECLACVIDTLQRYSTIWACMDAVAPVVNALRDTYYRWKAKGLQSKQLLTTILEFDHNQHLSEDVRMDVVADINAFASALQPLVEDPPEVPSTLHEVHGLTSAITPEAASTVAYSLWIKYRTSHDWPVKVWENALSALQSIAAASNPDSQAARDIILRYANFLVHIDQHLPVGLDGHILDWLNTTGKNEMPFLQPSTWLLLEPILLYLVVVGALSSTTVLRGLVYPACQLAASSSGPVDPTTLAYLAASHSLFYNLLLEQKCHDREPSAVSFPRDMFDIQRLRTRRRKVYHEPHFSELVGMIPLLIHIESSGRLPEQLCSRYSVLRRELCQDRTFRQGAYRNLDVIRAAFETSPYLMDTSLESLRKDAVAGLRMVLWDSVQGGDIDDWPEVSALLSPWKLAATTIQMQFQVKQLGRALGQETTHAFASSNLNKLTVLLFQSTKTAEEAYYVGEMTKGADPAVAMKFIKAGLNFMKDMLLDENPTNRTCEDSIKRLGELLRILIHATAPFRKALTDELTLDPTLQEEFLRLLYSRISRIEGNLERHNGCGPDEYIQNLVLLVRLLQFVLNFRGANWTQSMKDIGKDLAKVLLNMVIYFGSGSHVHHSVYPILFDTLILIYDDIAPDPKSLPYDPFKYYPDPTTYRLPTDMPSEYAAQILPLLKRNPPSPVVADLANAYHDAQGGLVITGPVTDRPWDWVENLGDPSYDLESADTQRDWFQHKTTLKNSGSLTLETFGAQLTGDTIVTNFTDGDLEKAQDMRLFEDGLSSESVFARDFRETRIEINPEEVTEHFQHAGLDEAMRSPHSSGTRHDTSARGSRASSVVSGISTHPSTSSRKLHQSPSRFSTATMSENMDLDMPSTSRIANGSKRKLDDDDGDDDEIQIVEGPVRSARARAGSTATKTTAGKTRAGTRKR